MKFNLLIILLVLQICEIIKLSTSVIKNGHCTFTDYDIDLLSCHNFTMADINGFTYPKLNPNKINVNIKRLDFSNSNFDYFTTIFFGHFYGSLQAISAYNCKINDILDETFTTIPNVTHLDFRSNEIKELRSKTFYNLKKLTTLNLANNVIDTIKPDTFKNLNLLEIIHLDNNKLKFISPNTFKMITNIKGLFLRNNPIYGELFLNINNITKFSAYNCGLTKFSISINSGVIKELSLASNKLKDVYLAEYKIKELQLSHNEIKRIDKIDGSELTELHLDGNPLDYNNIQNDFVNMTKLQFLSLSQTNLVKLNKEMFKSLNNLRNLNIADNPLKEAEALEVIKEIPNLRNSKIIWYSNNNYNL